MVFSKHSTAVLALCLLLAATGCAQRQPLNSTEIGTPYQAVSIATPGVTGASCFLQAGSMSYAVSPPAAVQVRRTPQKMAVTCFKGEHFVGHELIKPIVAPSESAALRPGQICKSCAYPGTIAVTMLLDKKSMERKITIGP